MAAKTVERDYLKLAAQRMTTPSRMTPKFRILVYSRNKKGKTTFCMSANEIGRILIIDPEGGTEKYKKSDPHVWPISQWEDVQPVWGALRTGKLSPKVAGLGPEEEPYDWVALDGMTKINNMALRYIMRMGEEANLDRRPGIVDRRDYNKSGELIKELILKFDALPVSVIYTAQERVISQNEDAEADETNESSVFFVPDLPAGARGSVNSVVDVIGRLYVTKAQFKNPKDPDNPIEKNQRRLWVGDHPQYDTGFRTEISHQLPDVVKNPTVKRIVDLILEGA